MSEDYCIKELYFGSECDGIWEEEIDFRLDNDRLIISTSVDLVVEIHKAYSSDPAIMNFTIKGNGNKQSFAVNLENTASCIVVFKNSENDVVYVKRTRGF